MEWESAEEWVVEKSSGTLVDERSSLRDLTGEVVEPEVEADVRREAAERSRDLTGEVIVGEVECADEGSEFAEVRRDRSVELIGREVKLRETLHLRPDPGGDLTVNTVSRE